MQSNKEVKFKWMSMTLKVAFEMQTSLFEKCFLDQNESKGLFASWLVVENTAQWQNISFESKISHVYA